MQLEELRQKLSQQYQEPFNQFTDRILGALETRGASEPEMDFELRTRDHILYCEHGAPLGRPCFQCQNPGAMPALTEQNRA